MPGPFISLRDTLPERATLKIEPEETLAEQAARLKAEGRARILEDIKGMIVFVITLCCILGVGGLAAYQGFFNPNASLEAKHWGPTVLASLFTGSLSFILGRAVGKASGR